MHANDMRLIAETVVKLHKKATQEAQLWLW